MNFHSFWALKALNSFLSHSFIHPRHLYFNPTSFIHGRSFIFSFNLMACISIRLQSFTAASSSLTSIVRLTFQFNFIPLWWLFIFAFNSVAYISIQLQSFTADPSYFLSILWLVFQSDFIHSRRLCHL